MLKVDLHQLNRGFRLILKNIQFELKPGESLFIYGSNGCGKTSLLRSILGLLRCEISTSCHISEMAHVATKSGLDTALTIYENLSRFQALEDSDTDIKHVASLFNLHSFLDQFPSHLSFGQIQRVNLSRLGFTKRKVWLLDEPLTGLDQQHQSHISAYLNTHLENGGIVLYASHQDLQLKNQRSLDLNLDHEMQNAA